MTPQYDLNTDTIEALRNPRTDKLFIVLEYESLPGKIKVINPEGAILDVAQVIFDIDQPVMVASDHFAGSFSEKQLDEYKKYQTEQTNRVRNVERHKSIKPEFTGEVKARARRNSEPKSSSKTPRRVEWESDGLAFYRHHIEPLRDHDIMVIRVMDVGKFEMTKAEFLRTFNFVVMSSDYRVKGVVHVPEITDAARKFLKS